jgi:tRNA(adenine34) deaminase
MCASALVQSRLERLVYGALDPKQGAAGTVWNLTDDRRLNHRVEVLAGILANECGALLTSFFRAQKEGPASAGPSQGSA